MAQTVAKYRQEGDDIDYTPTLATLAGTVVNLGANLIGITKVDIAANVLGAAGIKGIFRVPKSSGAIARGDAVYWVATGTPVTGDASSGAATATAGTGVWMGTAIAAAASGDSYVDVDLNSSGAGLTGGVYFPVSVTAVGAAQGNAGNTSYGFNLVAGADGNTGVILPTPVPGRTLVIKNNAGSALKVYPQVGGTINALSANTNYAQAANTPAEYYAWNATAWFTLPLVAS